MSQAENQQPAQRVAVVTGGASGIGLATALRLQAEGCRTAILCRSTLTPDCPSAKAGLRAFVCDVSDFDQCARAIAAVEAELGPVDILVNDAGVTADSTLHKMSLEQWRQVLSVDLDSMFNVCRQVVGGMRERGFGRIVNIASINGQKGQFGQANYSAAKAGVIGFTKALALESARKGVTVNAIAPGYIDTAMLASVPKPILAEIVEAIPVGRLGRPEEIARCVSFLVAEDAGFITGAVLAANGGQYMIG